MDEMKEYKNLPLRIKRYFSPLTPPELSALLENLDKLEKRVFEFLKYPEITYKNRRFLTCEKIDREFVEALFIDLYSICNNGRLPFVTVVRYFEDHFNKYQRLHARKAIDHFHFEVIKQVFFHLYEANKAVRDETKREDYLKKYGVVYYSEDRSRRIRQLGSD